MRVRVDRAAGDEVAPAGFVGREAALRRLRASVEAAARGAGGVVLIAGEPGIGKSRLAEEGVRGLRLRALWGHCWHGDEAPAFWPWMQVLRPLAEEASQIPPEISTLLEASPGSDERGGDPARARFQLFQAVSSLIRAASDRQPLVVVLDDLQWADPSSLLLLRHLAPELAHLPAAVVGTYRDVEVGAHHPLAAAVAEMGGSATTVPLGGLDLAGVRALAAHLTERDPGEDVAAELHAATGGNPFFVGELVRLREEGVPGAIPPTVAEAIGRRRATLSTAADGAVRAASVLGREFDAGDVAALVVGEDPRAALEEAVGARILADTEVPGRLRFAHDLVRETFARAIAPAERARLHRAAADVASRREVVSPEEVAHHLLHALPEVDPLRVTRALEEAGAWALARRAYDEAVAYLERAAAIEEGVRPRDDERRCALLLALGDARFRAGKLAAARESYLRAAELARAHGWVERLSAAAVGFQSLAIYVAYPDEELIALLETAVEQRPPSSALRARLFARLSWELFLTDLDRSRRLAREAEREARRSGDPEAIGTALTSLYATLLGISSADERRPITAEIRRLAAETGRFDLQLWGRIWEVVDLLELGDMSGVDREIAALSRLSERDASPYFRWWPAIWRSMRALLEGRFDDAEVLAERALEVGAGGHPEKARMYFAMQVGLIWDERGRLEELESAMVEAVARHPTLPVYRCRLALARARLGRHAEARADLDRLAVDAFAAVPRDALWPQTAAILAELCRELDDAASAAVLSRLLRPFAGRTIVGGYATLSRGPADRYLGLLAATRGRLDDAVADLESSLELSRRMGARPWSAHAMCDLAEVLWARGSDGDAERAGQLLRDVLAEAAAMGMTSLLARAEGLATERDVATEAAQTGDARGAAAFRREGDVWTVSFAGRTIRLRDAKGLRDIAQLLRSPGRETHVLDLVAAAEGRGRPNRAATPEGLSPAAGALGPALDDRARAEYRARIEELQGEADDADLAGDVARAERARSELDALTTQLASAYGLGGRPRSVGDPSERARKAVTTRIRYVLDRIGREHRELARHLERSIRTGTFCSYAPEHPVDWSF